jgi:hypothetical protein
MKQNYMTQDTATQIIKNQLKSNFESEMTADFRGNQCMDNSTGPWNAISR